MSRRATNEVVYGELAWCPFEVRAACKLLSSMWTRITEMPESSLTRKAMNVQRKLLGKDKKGWLKSLKSTLVFSEDLDNSVHDIDISFTRDSSYGK